MIGILEAFYLRQTWRHGIQGPLALDPVLRDAFLRAPYDIAPAFRPPLGRERAPRRGRGRDHPRYGRFIYVWAATLQPALAIEVGTYAGGTAAGWARAFAESGRGRLICVDNDTYSAGTYPGVTRRNLATCGLSSERYDLTCGNSRDIVPALARELRGTVDAYLVDGDHTYEGALADLRNGAGMMKPGGWILVHDVDRGRRMAEATPEHPHPVYDAFMDYARESAADWCILTFIRKHLGVLRVPHHP